MANLVLCCPAPRRSVRACGCVARPGGCCLSPRGLARPQGCCLPHRGLARPRGCCPPSYGAAGRLLFLDRVSRHRHRGGGEAVARQVCALCLRPVLCVCAAKWAPLELVTPEICPSPTPPPTPGAPPPPRGMYERIRACMCAWGGRGGARVGGEIWFIGFGARWHAASAVDRARGGQHGTSRGAGPSGRSGRRVGARLGRRHD